MIIYKDILTGDEIVSDTYKLIEAGNGLWEVDGKMITKGNEDFVLDGANPSAEGEDADEGGDGGGGEQVIDIVDAFRLSKIEGGMEKKDYVADTKKYLKAVMDKLKTAGKTEEMEQFKKDAPGALKKIQANFDKYDIYQGESSTGEISMYVLIDFREDGMTPYATIWKAGLTEMKV